MYGHWTDYHAEAVDWGKLPVLRVGRKAIVRRDTLERFMAVNQGRNLLREGDVRRVE